MAKFARVTMAAILLTVAGTAVCEADSNPLLGNWKLSGPGWVDRSGHNACAGFPGLSFTATTQILYIAASKFQPAYQTPTTVHYLVNGNKVYVSSTESFGGAPSYIIDGPNKITSNDADHCSYDRK
jgi:hypothetical protein